MGLVVLNVYGEDLERSGNLKQKVFVWTRHGCFVVVRSIDEFLIKIFQLEDHCFWFIGYMCN